uniref:Uncharacterized protein n=1 Tax=Triticum aestivum TaxID=4565 RepID=A0A3B6KGK1_WHEAT
MARGLAVAMLLLVAIAAVAPLSYAGSEVALTDGVATTTTTGESFSTGLPLYREIGKPAKDAANAAGDSVVSGGLASGLPLYQETGSGEKKA